MIPYPDPLKALHQVQRNAYYSRLRHPAAVSPAVQRLIELGRAVQHLNRFGWPSPAAEDAGPFREAT